MGEVAMKSGASSILEGYLLASPIRRLMYDPERILRPYVERGMTVLDVGCGMGFFSLATAKLVGPNGRVVAIDLQPKMIHVLKRRATKAGLSERIDARVCQKDSLGGQDLAASVNVALVLNMIHEVSDRHRFLEQIHYMLVQKGRILLVGPRAHMSARELTATEANAQMVGFSILDRPSIKGSGATLLEKEQSS